MHTLQWFINRIGKIVYRDKLTCKCSTCKSVEKDGVLIHDKNHAEYLYMVSCDMDIGYRDDIIKTPVKG